MTWPLAARLTTHLPGHTTDTFVHYWNGWWVHQALSQGRSPFYTPYLSHPQGLSLVYHNFAWMNIIGWQLLKPLVDGIAAYNLCFLFNFALCGLAAFLLTYELTGNRGAAFLAGLIYQCWPFRLSQLDHPNLISTQFIPLFLLFLIRTLSSTRKRARWRNGVLTGVFLALVGYTRWQLLIPAAIIGGVYLIYIALKHWANWDLWREWLPALLLAGGITALALTPPALLLINQQRTAPADLVKEEEGTVMQTDLLAYVTPSDSHPMLGSITRPAYDRYYADRTGGRRFPAYIGLTALMLSLLGIWRIRRASLPWVAMALVLILLALGPTLRVGGELYPNMPMPYRLAGRFFLVRLIRVPDRFNLFLALPIAVLAAYGVAQVLTVVRERSPAITTVVTLLIGGAIIFECTIIPAPLQRTWLSSFYAQIADESGDFAVLNLPIDSQKSKNYMFAQTTHQHPILQGKTARSPEGMHAYLESHPLLRTLRQVGEINPELTDVSRQLASLAEDDVRCEAIILHKDKVGADRIAHWQRYLPTRPRFEDRDLIAYATEPQAGRDFELMEEMATGLGPVHVITSTNCLNPGRVLEVDVAWGTTAPPEQDFRVELALMSDEASQRETFALSPGWPTQEWPVNALAWGYYVLRIDPSLPPGPYTITLTLVDSETGTRSQSFAVGRATVQQAPCQLPAPSDAVEMNAVFGDELRLLGYQLRQEPNRLMLTLYWHAEQRMETDYKIFVHVFDPKTKVPVAQDDAMPHRWGYPTRFWGPGEMVRDDIPIYLQGAPPGEYGVAVGAYDPQTMERLPVMNVSGQRYDDGRLVLTGEKVEVRR